MYWFDLLPDPDYVGSSEYRAIYETLEGAGEDIELARAILDTFIETATELKGDLDNHD